MNCDHPEEECCIKWIQTVVDSRPKPRWFCKKCEEVGHVIYKLNPISGNPILNER